jgi:CRISPR-associated protein Cas1
LIKRTIVIESAAALRLERRQLVIERAELPASERKRTVPIEDLGILVLESAHTTVTNGLYSALVEAGVAVIHCNDRHMPIGLTMPLAGHTLQQARFQAQLSASLPLRKQLWMQLIQSKIRNQASTLALVGAPYQPLLHWSKEVRSGDPDNLEARAAAYYWPLLMGDTAFRRQREGTDVNMALNYGYAILRATVARALVISGLLPTMGVHHRNQYNAYCLADDVMEPYRPLVDAYVVELMQSMPLLDELSREWRTALLKIPALDVRIRGERSPLLVAVGRTTASMAQVFEGVEKKLLLPKPIRDVISTL